MLSNGSFLPCLPTYAHPRTHEMDVVITTLGCKQSSGGKNIQNRVLYAFFPASSNFPIHHECLTIYMPRWHTDILTHTHTHAHKQTHTVPGKGLLKTCSSAWKFDFEKRQRSYRWRLLSNQNRRPDLDPDRFSFLGHDAKPVTECNRYSAAH